MNDTKENTGNAEEKISLSAALLAPINSIFEAQIHSARAFLNFILQMGFRHQKKENEFDSKEEYEKHLKEISNNKKKIRVLLQEKKTKGSISEEKASELKRLNADYGDLYNQNIDFIDNAGNEFQVSIPNLALLPVKPLAISEAEFSYEFAVDSETKTYRQNGAAIEKSENDKGSPWFLIKEPKSIRGSIAESKEDASSKTIKIHVKVGNTEMPYGLEKLMVHLTNSIESIDNYQE